MAYHFLLTMLTAMIPVVELRGAIPFGVALGLRPLTAYAGAVIGNLIPIPFIILFIRNIFKWMRRRWPHFGALIDRMEQRARLKSDTVVKYGFIGLCILVAIPLPGTGAWTGALVAVIMDIRLKRAMPAIVLGVLIAGLVVTLITCGVSAVI